jgi:hypothetical protein
MEENIHAFGVTASLVSKEVGRLLGRRPASPWWICAFGHERSPSEAWGAAHTPPAGLALLRRGCDRRQPPGNTTATSRGLVKRDVLTAVASVFNSAHRSQRLEHSLYGCMGTRRPSRRGIRFAGWPNTTPRGRLPTGGCGQRACRQRWCAIHRTSAADSHTSPPRAAKG